MNVNVVVTFICCVSLAIWEWSNFDKTLDNFDQRMLTPPKILFTNYDFHMLWKLDIKGAL